MNSEATPAISFYISGRQDIGLKISNVLLSRIFYIEMCPCTCKPYWQLFSVNQDLIYLVCYALKETRQNFRPETLQPIRDIFKHFTTTTKRQLKLNFQLGFETQSSQQILFSFLALNFLSKKIKHIKTLFRAMLKMAKHTFKPCSVHTTRFSKSAGPFFNIMHERVKQLNVTNKAK